MYGKARIKKLNESRWIAKAIQPPVVPTFKPLPVATIPPKIPVWKVIHSAADQQTDELLNKIVDVSHDLRQGAEVTPMIQGINNNDAEAVLKAIPFEKYAAGIGATTNILKIAFNNSGSGMIIHLPESYRDFTFDTANDRAINTIAKQGSKLVTEVTGETRAAINAEIKKGIAEGLGGDKVADNLLNLIGLTTQQAGAVTNFRIASLEAGINPGQVDKLAEEYSDRLLNYRALTIARTETMRAANDGYKEMIMQGIDAGMIPQTARLIWIVTPDDRLCDECNDMDGEIADENGDFTDDMPLHPNCRCVPGTDFGST